MGWRLIVYCVLALALTGSFLFITIENESLSSKENSSSIFNAKEIEIRSTSKNKEIFYSIESEMINALSNSNNLSIFKPKIEINNKLETQNIKFEDKNLNLSPELKDVLIKNENNAIQKKDKTIVELVEKRNNFQKNINKKKQRNKKKEKPISFINKIIISLITLIAIIILIDTFRNEIINFLPGLNPAFNSFYEIIADINSFIKDLIR